MQHKKHIRFDWAIKRLLRQKTNFGILEGFLSELLKEDIQIVEIIESMVAKVRQEIIQCGRSRQLLPLLPNDVLARVQDDMPLFGWQGGLEVPSRSNCEGYDEKPS